jgi:hypothetical protein
LPRYCNVRSYRSEISLHLQYILGLLPQRLEALY